MPTLTLLQNGEVGVAAQIATATSGSPGTWQQISLQAFTPSAQGIVKIRLTSYDQSGISVVRFGTLAG